MATRAKRLCILVEIIQPVFSVDVSVDVSVDRDLFRNGSDAKTQCDESQGFSLSKCMSHNTDSKGSAGAGSTVLTTATVSTATVSTATVATATVATATVAKAKEVIKSWLQRSNKSEDTRTEGALSGLQPIEKSSLADSAADADRKPARSKSFQEWKENVLRNGHSIASSSGRKGKDDEYRFCLETFFQTRFLLEPASAAYNARNHNGTKSNKSILDVFTCEHVLSHHLQGQGDITRKILLQVAGMPTDTDAKKLGLQLLAASTANRGTSTLNSPNFELPRTPYDACIRNSFELVPRTYDAGIGFLTTLWLLFDKYLTDPDADPAADRSDTSENEAEKQHHIDSGKQKNGGNGKQKYGKKKQKVLGLLGDMTEAIDDLSKSSSPFSADPFSSYPRSVSFGNPVSPDPVAVSFRVLESSPVSVLLVRNGKGNSDSAVHVPRRRWIALTTKRRLFHAVLEINLDDANGITVGSPTLFRDYRRLPLDLPFGDSS